MQDGANLNEIRKSIIEEIARMRKQRLILVMHKELGEMILGKSQESEDLNNAREEVQLRVNETTQRISELDDMIRMGEIALKIHAMIEEDE